MSQVLIEEAGRSCNLVAGGSNWVRVVPPRQRSLTKERSGSIKISHQEIIFQDFLFLAPRT